jgi:hypothetical protein
LIDTASAPEQGPSTPAHYADPGGQRPTLAQQANRANGSHPYERTPEDPDQTHFDADVDLRDVQIAARHADPRTTMRYDRARKHLDRHPNYILASYMAAGT